MVREALTQELIESGKSLVQKLDASGAKVDAAFWFYFPDVGTWKLMLSLPALVVEGPKKAYRRIQSALGQLPAAERAFSLDDVAIAKPDAAILSLLRVALKTGPGISDIRFTDNVINGVVVNDAYIYRLT